MYLGIMTPADGILTNHQTYASYFVLLINQLWFETKVHFSNDVNSHCMVQIQLRLEIV